MYNTASCGTSNICSWRSVWCILVNGVRAFCLWVSKYLILFFVRGNMNSTFVIVVVQR
jgi:hypothetical protein